MENEDDHNYTDVMTGYWNTVGFDDHPCQQPWGAAL